MTPSAIIADFFDPLPDDQRFPVINRFLSDIVNRNIQILPQEIMKQLLTTIQPIDEHATKAIALLEKKLIEILDRA
ncbi:hypothetical protein HP567_029735 (plasmid) [Brevibacillus sp. M2.1A]|uniref:hypothetical protein n=1 Tax=Brevibacillus TaxID=55080 RepID=UPI00156B18E6|nr:hypothetical protein [Brevibacillus sp. M2.1A]MCC8438718.1 hypothetical protein [Brevibacillus sp. M2.1A]